MSGNPDSLLEHARNVTGWSDDMLAEIVGIGTSTVYAYRAGTRTEYLNAVQLRALRQALALYRDQVVEGVAQFELMI